MIELLAAIGEAVPEPHHAHHAHHPHALALSLALSVVVRLAGRLPRGCAERKALARAARELDEALAV